jgi:hypothetical protein
MYYNIIIIIDNVTIKSLLFFLLHFLPISIKSNLLKTFTFVRVVRHRGLNV